MKLNMMLASRSKITSALAVVFVVGWLYFLEHQLSSPNAIEAERHGHELIRPAKDLSTHQSSHIINSPENLAAAVPTTGSTTTSVASEVVTILPSSTDHHGSRQMGAVVILAPKRRAGSLWGSRFCLMAGAIRSFDRHVNCRFGAYKYPIYVMVAADPEMDDDPGVQDMPYTHEDKQGLLATLQCSQVIFVEIPMYSGDALEPNVSNAQVKRWVDGKDGGIAGQRLGYRSMCRLYGGRVQRLPFLSGHTYLMRLDDDSYITSRVPFDPFEEMKEKDLMYSYKKKQRDNWGIKEMWELALPFVDPQLMTDRGMLLSLNSRYTGTQPYNNFHVSRRDMWSDPKLLQYAHVVDKASGYFKYRFGDANIHAIVLGIVNQPGRAVALWSNFPYVHNGNDDVNYPPKAWQCKSGLANYSFTS